MTASGPLMAWVGLGANLGEARATLEATCRELAVCPGVRWVGRSAWYRSAPFEASGPDFVNAVVRLDWSGSPPQLLEVLQALEATHGRERPYRHAPRTLDLDLLACGPQSWSTPRLQLPHPRWLERAFVLLPLLDLTPATSLFDTEPWRSTLQAAGLAEPQALRRHAEALSLAQGIERLPD